MKFGRIFAMQVEGKTATHLITSPLTCRLRVSGTGTPSASTGYFRVYNLSPDVRNDLFVDPFSTGFYRGVVFSAGYDGAPLPIIFKGNVYRCFSYRQGPDWVTDFDCLDGSYAIENGDINLSVPTPYDFRQVVARIVAGMPKVKLGVIGQFASFSSRGITFCGNPWDLLIRKVLPLEGQLYIDQERVNIVQQREYIVGQGLIEEISDLTGMIGTPYRQEGQIRVRMLFEPGLEMMQKITVRAVDAANSGDFKVMRIDHQGTISDAVCENLITEVTGFQPSLSLQAAA